MRKTDIAILFLLVFNYATAWASVPELWYSDKQGQHVTDEMLKNIAVEKGVIPEDAGEAFFKEAVEKKNAAAIWAMIDNKAKLSVIDNFRKLNKEEGVTIRLPSEYYVREITADIYNSIVKGDVVVMELGNIFKTIAVMEGDYDNGKDKIEFAREYMGEDGFQMYKRLYPGKYEKLRNGK